MYFAAFGSGAEQMMKRGGLKDAMSFFTFCGHIEYVLTSVPCRLLGGIRAIREKHNCALGQSRARARADGREGVWWRVDPRHLAAAGLPFLLSTEHATCKGSWHTPALRLGPI